MSEGLPTEDSPVLLILLNSSPTSRLNPRLRRPFSPVMYDLADTPREYTLGKLTEATRRLGYTMTVEKTAPVAYRDPDK